MDHLKEAVKYLEESTTPLTRKRGRKYLRQVVGRLLNKYPLIDKNGKERKPTPCVCPFCKVPMFSWKSLATHLKMHHGCNAKDDFGYPSSGGQCPACAKRFKTTRALALHLSSLARRGKLAEHCVPAATHGSLARTTVEYGVWVTKPDGTEGFWLNDGKPGNPWHGDRKEADCLANERIPIHTHKRYEVREFVP